MGLGVLTAQLVINGLASGCLYALLALGFTLIWKSAAAANFAQGDFAAVGMFAALTCRVLLGWPLLLSLAAAVGIGFGFGLLVERLAIRPILRSDPVTKIIATLGVSIITSNALRLIFGASPRYFPPYLGEVPLRLGPLSLVPQNLWIAGIALAAIVLLQRLYYGTILGKALRAVAERQDVAALMGINPTRMVALAFGLSAALGALAGIMLAPLIYVSSDLSFALVIKALLAAVIGGFGSYPGALLGGLLIGVLDNLAAFFISSELRDVISFSVLIAVLLVRPTGLMGEPVREA